MLGRRLGIAVFHPEPVASPQRLYFVGRQFLNPTTIREPIATLVVEEVVVKRPLFLDREIAY